MIGQTILHYKISAKLGEGGMGEVYLATDTKLSRPVALKFLSSSVATNADAKQRLLLEAQAASRLNHPNIITVHAVEFTDAGSFVVSEYVDGATLRDARSHLSEQQLLSVFCQVCDALAEAHSQGIVHRDIKPENIMVDAKGRAKVMDFGLARDLRSTSGMSATNAVAGTAYYMAPEQLLGETSDHRTDIFSLGAVMYEMLTDVKPFDGDYDMAVLYAIVNTDPPPLSEFNPAIPDDLDTLVHRCLAKQPEDRWSDAQEIALALDRAATAWSSATKPTTSAGQTSQEITKAEPQDKLLGRDAEIEELIGSIQSVRQHTGTTVLITGESGVGKTRLAEEVCRRLRSAGMTVLRARCLPQSGGLPYHAFATAMQQVLPRWDTTLVAQLLERGKAAGIDLTHRLPILQAFLEPTSTSRGLLNREQVWDAVLMLLRVIATERPVVISIDDLHWADTDTLDLFSYLGRNVTEFSLALLGTLRESGVTETAAIPFEAILRQLRLDSGARFLELKRFTTDETRRLVLHLLDASDIDSDLVGLIVKRSAGNPLFVRELVAYLKTSSAIVQADGQWRLRHSEHSLPIPRHIQDLVSERIERLIPDDRAILEYASCETDYFDSHSLCACLGVERIALLKRLQELESKHGLIQHDRTRYRFDHPLIREILYESILPELRMEYHRQIADYLIGEVANKEDVSARIAHHLVASDRRQEAIPYLLTAADRARDVHANNEALRLYRQIEAITNGKPIADPALALRLAAGLGDVLLALGHVVESIRHFERAVQLAENTGDNVRTTELLTRLAVPLRINGQLDRAIETATRAVTLARATDDSRRTAMCLNTLAFIHAAHGPYDQTIALSEESLELMVKSPDPQIESIALGHLGHAHVHRGEFRRAVEVLERAISQQRAIGDTRGLAQSLNFAGLAYGRLGQFSRGLTAHFESLKTKRALNDVSVVPGSLNGIGDTYRDLGMLTEATRYHTESLALAREQGNIGSQCDNLRDLGANAILSGDLDAAERYLRDVQKLAVENGYKWYICRTLISQCDLAVARKDTAEAERLSAEAVDAARDIGAGELIVESLWVRAKTRQLQNRTDDATATMCAAIDTATRIDLHNLLWHLHHYLAGLYTQQGRHDEAQQSSANARTELDQIIADLDDEDLRTRFTGLPEVQAVMTQT